MKFFFCFSPYKRNCKSLSLNNNINCWCNDDVDNLLICDDINESFLLLLRNRKGVQTQENSSYGINNRLESKTSKHESRILKVVSHERSHFCKDIGTRISLVVNMLNLDIPMVGWRRSDLSQDWCIRMIAWWALLNQLNRG